MFFWMLVDVTKLMIDNIKREIPVAFITTLTRVKIFFSKKSKENNISKLSISNQSLLNVIIL
jgi:hypothetical protein